MGAKTAISWCDKTFNPWWGCNHVSPGCDHCYMDFFVTNRAGYNGVTKPVIMGPPHATTRRLFGEKHWREPLGWNASAFERGVRELVFCASMADVFEFNPLLDAERLKLWAVIESTLHLDWLLLTKRPQLISRMVPQHWMEGGWPRNVWIGTSAEDTLRFMQRWPHLAVLPAPVRFISAEPLLGPIDLSGATPDWIITGGESGPGWRPMELDWARAIRDQSLRLNLAFFHKQGGGFKPGRDTELDGHNWHQWPKVEGVPGQLGGVRALPGAELIPA